MNRNLEKAQRLPRGKVIKVERIAIRLGAHRTSSFLIGNRRPRYREALPLLDLHGLVVPDVAGVVVRVFLDEGERDVAQLGRGGGRDEPGVVVGVGVGVAEGGGRGAGAGDGEVDEHGLRGGGHDRREL